MITKLLCSVYFTKFYLDTVGNSKGQDWNNIKFRLDGTLFQ